MDRIVFFIGKGCGWNYFDGFLVGSSLPACSNAIVVSYTSGFNWDARRGFAAFALENDHTTVRHAVQDIIQSA